MAGLQVDRLDSIPMMSQKCEVATSAFAKLQYLDSNPSEFPDLQTNSLIVEFMICYEALQLLK